MNLVVGVDEVGRGCLAGPLVAAAVMLTRNIPGLNDSKQLSRGQRETLAVQIYNTAKVGIGWVTAEEIDTNGLTRAVTRAMKCAIDNIACSNNEIIIDGNFNFLKELPNTRAIVKADATFPAVSAASIIAKVARDQYMIDAAIKYPDYGFERHVGYGTSMHMEALRKHGPCKMHRRSYKPLKDLVSVIR